MTDLDAIRARDTRGETTWQDCRALLAEVDRLNACMDAILAAIRRATPATPPTDHEPCCACCSEVNRFDALEAVAEAARNAMFYAEDLTNALARLAAIGADR